MPLYGFLGAPLPSECQEDLDSSTLKCWNVENIEKLKVEMLKMLKSWKLKCWNAENSKTWHSLRRETCCISTISTFSTFQLFNFSTFQLSTFQQFQHFQLSTFQHFNFPYRIQIGMSNLRKLKSWKVEKLKVEMLKIRKMLKCWKLPNVEKLKCWKVERLKSWNAESWT